jgi:hypothetical protein
MSDTKTKAAGLRNEIERAGYYPLLVAEAVEAAIAGEHIKAYVVHQETTFDTDEVRRHITVLVLTPTRLVIGHTDDHSDGSTTPTSYATTSTELVPVSKVHSVVVTRVFADPASYVPGMAPHEVSLSIGWGAVSRLDIEPATCGDPACEADHGYTGTASADDLVFRVSADAEGPAAVRAAIDFAAALSALTAGG